MKKMQLKNKLKKFIFVLPIFLVVFSFLCIPISAISTSETTTLSGVTVQGASFYRLFGSWTSSGDGISVSNNGVSLQVTTNDPSGWGANAGAYFKFEYVLYFENLSPSDTSNISFDVVLYSINGDNTVNSVTTQHSYISNLSDSVRGGVSKVSDSQLFYAINSFTGNTLKVATCFNQSAGTAVIYRIEIQNVNIDTLGTQDIIANQDKNASEIMQNQNENTDEILNGWDTDASPDENTTDDYSDIEQSLIDDTQDNADNANVEVTDNFVGSLQRYVSGFGAVSQMFSDLLLVQVPDVNGIVWFSLAMGVVPLIVGSAVIGLRSRDRAAARDRSNSVGGRRRKY